MTRSHLLLEKAIARVVGQELDLRPPSCTYVAAVGAWVVDESGALLVESPDRFHAPRTKKHDIETGEDQKSE